VTAVADACDTLATRRECPPCSNSGYLADWHYGLNSWGQRTAWCFSRRCPFCGMAERDRLAWLLASMRMPGSARRI
jgi:hypothetical protein